MDLSIALVRIEVVCAADLDIRLSNKMALNNFSSCDLKFDSQRSRSLLFMESHI